MTQSIDPKVLIALDYDNKDEAIRLARQLNPKICRLKVGKELFTSCGPQVLEDLHRLGFQIFLDLKFHDIPATVAKAVKSASKLGVWMVNVHASGGERMLHSARESVVNIERPPLLIAVTVLTSMEARDLSTLGVERGIKEQVIALARLAKEAELDGVVSSAQEASMLRQECGKEFLLVTPGIRPNDSNADDQRRIVTPEEAVANGSDYLVIGRPITLAADPGVACRNIVASLQPELREFM